jgi:hypothetical protein
MPDEVSSDLEITDDETDEAASPSRTKVRADREGFVVSEEEAAEERGKPAPERMPRSREPQRPTQGKRRRGR